VGQRFGLAAAGAGQYQQGTFRCFGGPGLLGVEIFEQILHCPRIVTEKIYWPEVDEPLCTAVILTVPSNSLISLPLVIGVSLTRNTTNEGSFKFFV
jgi:hypothetical protein